MLVGHATLVYIREKTLMDGSVLVMHFQKEFLKKILFEVDPRNLSECNNGIGYEERLDNILRGI